MESFPGLTPYEERLKGLDAFGPEFPEAQNNLRHAQFMDMMLKLRDQIKEYDIKVLESTPFDTDDPDLAIPVWKYEIGNPIDVPFDFCGPVKDPGCLLPEVLKDEKELRCDDLAAELVTNTDDLENFDGPFLKEPEGGALWRRIEDIEEKDRLRNLMYTYYTVLSMLRGMQQLEWKEEFGDPSEELSRRKWMYIMKFSSMEEDTFYFTEERKKNDRRFCESWEEYHKNVEGGVISQEHERKPDEADEPDEPCDEYDEPDEPGNLSMNKIKDAFRRSDVDGDGKINAEELAYLFERLSPGEIEPEELEDLLADIDQDGDGRLDFQELVDYLMQ